MSGAERRVWVERAVSAELRPLIGGDLTVLGPGTTDDLYAGIEEAHGVIASILTYDGPVMDRAPDLQVIARTGIGYDRIDVAAATARSIAVCNAPDGPTISTAEHAVALMLAAAKALPAATAAVRNGEPYPYEHHQGVELAGKTLGLVGFGRIARRVARAAAALDMTVCAHDPYLPEEAFSVARAARLGDLLEGADAVSVHVPLSDETEGMIDEDAFALMRDGVIFVNTARGGLVDQEALVAALETGKVGAAGLDVTDPEPLPAGHPLLGRDNVIVTPHIASSTPQARMRNFGIAVEQVVQQLSGRVPDHIVNPEVRPRGEERIPG